ncbi:hypothetical protein L6303_06000 [archaeon]|nr:hypothetical protein [Nanoarchaeota archaeon]MCG2724270.1 hypothetical protein [archaeon]
MTYTPLTPLKKDGYIGLIWLSCIDKPRNKLEITRKWYTSSSLSGRPLHRESAQKTIKALIDNGLLEADGNNYSSKFEGLPQLVDVFFPAYDSKKQKSNTLETLRSNEFIELLNKTWVREELLSLDVLYEFFNGSVDNVRANPLTPMIFILTSSTILDEIVKAKRLGITEKQESIEANLLRNWTSHIFLLFDSMFAFKLSAYFSKISQSIINHPKDWKYFKE